MHREKIDRHTQRSLSICSVTAVVLTIVLTVVLPIVLAVVLTIILAVVLAVILTVVLAIILTVVLAVLEIVRSMGKNRQRFATHVLATVVSKSSTELTLLWT